jgi:hypothetical protein
MSRRALTVPVLLAVMLAAGCGGAGGAPDAATAAAAGPPTASAPAPVATVTPTGAPGVAAPSGKPTVGPEVVVPSTTDARSQEILGGSWEARVVSALRQVDPRLVANRRAVVQKVRATCTQMETGMFSAKVVPVIVKRFSTPSLTVTSAMAQDIYGILLQDACYRMNES